MLVSAAHVQPMLTCSSWCTTLLRTLFIMYWTLNSDWDAERE